MKKILVAEDDVTLMGMYKGLINMDFPDYNVETFYNGTLLNSRLEQDVSDVALILTDNQMPYMDGSEIIKKYAKNQKFEKIPFILVYGGIDTIGYEAVKNGAYSFIKKPFDINKFVNMLKEAIVKK